MQPKYLPIALIMIPLFLPSRLPAEQDLLKPKFAVALPAEKLPFPTPLPEGRTEPGFKLIGTKGWAWTWDQFLTEIPVLAEFKMNFLMSCYTCVFTDTEKFVNRWWEPFPEKTRSGLENVARACREKGIAFCFSMHPQLYSERPLKHDSLEDFEALWQHYAYVQGLGVKWFSLSYDDIETKNLDKAALGRAHAGLANRLFRRLREKDPKAELIFCPVYYWGCGDTGDAKAYLEALGGAMDKNIIVFWTGDDVVTLRITRACAERFKASIGHRIFIWDNYPVNDRTGTLHLGPLTGRDPDLDEVAFGYMSNPHCPQNEINRIPLLTCADYAYNPRAYDPARSIGQAIVHLADTPAQREVLNDLVELYPGNLISGSTRTSFNSVLDRLDRILKEPNGRETAPQFISYVEHIAARLAEVFPGRYAETRKTLADHIVQLKAKLEKFRKTAARHVLSTETLKDKIRGGWAGQTIGCTFGGPTEFRFQGTLIPDYQPLPWSERDIAAAFKDNPGLYDDVYMDLTFVEVFAKEGLDAPAASFARAFADAPYPLWHANQMARYNILRGILPPRSGDWRNNPHADDIDFQIEADFAGLMSPGLPGAAAGIADRIGHIMNSGDGWYGGVYIATMYALAFIRDDIATIAEEALKAIPPETAFARAMADVIRWHREDPADWKSAWFKTLRAWGEDVGCPEGVFSSFDIDAKINCAWVLIGLLYGDGDFGKTLAISQRCGDDSDCNPASAGGILGTVLGYRNIPAAWTGGLAAIEDRPFPYTTISLADAARMSYDQAIENIRRYGGTVEADRVTIAVQAVAPVAKEINFEGHRPVERRPLGLDLGREGSFRFTGIGFAVNGEAVSTDGRKYVFRAEMLIDGKSSGIIELPTDRRLRNPTPFWAYGLPAGPHEVIFRVLNPAEGARLRLQDAIIYAEAKK
jgi:hypothetical protein